MIKPSTWAWIWLGCLAFLGWAPALLISWMLAYAIALGFGLQGPAVFRSVFALILLVSLFMAVQVRQFFGLSRVGARWYTLAGGITLVGVWVRAFFAITWFLGIR